MISIEQVESTEAAADQAQQARTEAQAALEASPYSQLKALELSEASAAAAQLAAAARELREAYEAQVVAQRAAVSREQLEAAASAEIEVAGQELEAAKARVGAAAEAAQGALVELMAAASAYSDVVDAQASVLAGLGLDVKGGQNGGSPREFFGAAVRVGGRLYRRADPGGVALWVLHRVADARLPRMHSARGALEGLGGQVMAGRTDGLCEALPVPVKVSFPRPYSLGDALAGVPRPNSGRSA